MREVKLVEDLGAKFAQGFEVGQDITLEELEDQCDAIFLAVGLRETWDLNLPGGELDDVYGALEFIERTKSNLLKTSTWGEK